MSTANETASRTTQIIAEKAEYIASERFSSDQRFWRDKFSVPPPRLFTRSRIPASLQSPRDEVVWLIERSRFNQAVEFAQAAGCTKHHFILALVTCYFARVSGETDIVIGVPVDNQNSPINETAGLLASVLPLRIAVDSERPFEDLLKTISAELHRCYRYQRLAISEIERCANLSFIDRETLYEITVSFESDNVTDAAGDIDSNVESPHSGFNRPPLAITVRDCDQGSDVAVAFDFNQSCLDIDEVEATQARIAVLFDSVLTSGDVPICLLSILAASERQQVLIDWNATESTYPQKYIHELFEAQVETRPDAIALIHEERSLTYGELNARVNQLARHLREAGVGPDTRVAICVKRSAEMVVAMLATLKAGGAYVPLDPSYPRERLAYILEDCAPMFLLTHDAAGAALTGHSLVIPVLNLDSDKPRWSHQSVENPDSAEAGLNPGNLAYVIYTSGSTGLPKGVMVDNRGVYNSAFAQIQALAVEPDSRVLQFASFSFDACVFEITWSLCRGAALVLPPSDSVSTSKALIETVNRCRVSHAALPPAVLTALPEDAVLDSLRMLIAGGEAVSREVVQRWSAGRRFFNGYGPTEATIWTTYRECRGVEAAAPPIGRPLVNTRIYALDSNCLPVPIEATGELYIGGAGVTRGYFNRPELTAESFLPDPFGQEPGARLYRTGDLGCWLREGEIEYQGRNDFQVKIRGFRIELGEIENKLAGHTEVREAVVLAREDGNGGKRLVAYYTGKEIGAEALRAHISSNLPDYMVPTAYVHLKSLPLTPNGKVDRRSLPAPEGKGFVTPGYESPVSDTEIRLARIWADLLKIERVGRHDNFFELGGHSLLVATLIERMRREQMSTDVRTLFTAPTLRALAEAVDGGTNPEIETPPNLIPPDSIAITPKMLPLVKLTQSEIDAIIATVPGGAGNVQDIYPLAPLQEGILFHHLMTPRGDTYVAQSLLAFDTREGLDKFLTALQAVIDRHDILRTAIVWEGLPEPVQVVWRNAPLIAEEVTLDSSGDDLANVDVARKMKEQFDPRRIRLDVGRAPLMRCIVTYDAPKERWLLSWLSHHLAIDHTTLEIMAHEAQAWVMGMVDRLPEPLPFRNFVAQARLGIDKAEHESFFKALLGDVEEPTAPFGLLNAQSDGSDVKEARIELDATLARRLRERARALGVSAASLCHLAWAQVLARVSGREDVVFGTVLFGRMHGGRGADRVLGLFINTLPIRIQVGDEAVAQSVRRTHALLADLMRHEHASLALAQRCSRVAAPAPLFSSLLNYVHSAPEGTQSENSEPVWAGVKALEAEERCNYPLTLSVEDFGEAFAIKAQVISPIDPGRICEFMQTVLGGLVEALELAPETAVRAIEAMPEAERRRVLVEWNATEADYPKEKSIHELFEAQVEKSPNAISVVHNGRRLTYRDLNKRANRLAHHLRKLGVESGSHVAILLERSVDLVVAELATLKCGAAYVPIDPTFPDERQVFMTADCEARVAITTRSRSLPPALEVSRVNIDDLTEVEAVTGNLNIPSHGELTAYVMYTSGSTGRPKGVRVAHKSIGRLVLNCSYTDFNSSDRVAFAANPAFDAATMEVWAPLLNGGRIVVIDRQALLDPKSFKESLEENGVTTLFLTTAIFNQYALAIPEALARLRWLLCGGERNDPPSFARVLEQAGPDHHLIHCYGPTETTTFAITHEVTHVPTGIKSIPLGRPISNTQIYILNANRQPVPIGVTGELYIGGAGVAQGYLNRPELTRERFVPDPFSREPEAKMYKTGDLGHWLPDGTIEFEGRNDFQVKIRGFRMELGEIEAKLATHAGIREVLVMAREDDESGKRLVAYYSGEEPGAEALRAHLSCDLPDYMVPSAYVHLERLPLTPNGKIDRRALPAPEDHAFARPGYEAPIGEIETQLAQIWAGALKLERVGRHDNFFELGGQSLLAVQVLSRVRQIMGVEVSVGDLFAHSVLSDFALSVERGSQTNLPSILPVDRNRPLELSFAQQRLWFLSQFEGASEAYHIAGGLRLIGDLDRRALGRALDRIVARHEALRTTFSRVDRRPVQVIGSPENGFDLEEHNLSQCADPLAELVRLAGREATEPFDLEQGPLIRGRLVRMADDDHALLLTMHHIVSDGWSMGVLADEMTALYKTYREGRAESLPELSIQYADYAAWQRQWLSGDLWQRQADYWKGALAGAPSLLELPADRTRPAQQNYVGDAVEIEFDAELARDLKALGRRHGATLYMTLLAGWAALLARLSGQEEVVIGSPMANRMRSEIEPLIGFFVNTLALRIDVSGSPTVAELLARVKTRTLEAQHNQDIPFEQVVEIVQPPRSLAHAPVFQAVFAWQNTPEGKLELPGLTVTPLAVPNFTAQFDLSLSLQEAGERIAGELEYATALFDRATARRYLGYWRSMLEAMVKDEEQSVARLPLLGHAERQQVLEDWNATRVDYSNKKCVHELFEAQVEHSPNAIALVHNGHSLTYGELNARANRLAHHLREFGVSSEDRVAVCVERGIEAIVALLATLKAGGVYVPLDPASPPQRLANMLEDCAPLVVLTLNSEKVAFTESSVAVPIVNLQRDAAEWARQCDRNPERGGEPSSLAYIIYTSGSTGLPKGVTIEHSSLTSQIRALQARYNLSSSDRLLQFVGLTFDVSLEEIFGALLSGSCIILRTDEWLTSGQPFWQLCMEHGVTILNLPTLFWQQTGEAASGIPAHVRAVIIGGDAVQRNALSAWFSRTGHLPRLFNAYGPTETTINATIDEPSPESFNLQSIGRPITNSRIFVLDDHGEPVPIGVAGELYIAGSGVARGYLGSPEMTARRFLPDPFSEEPGGRCYRTGDLGRWLHDGRIEFLGRNDFQVKLRGFRIELGEIEATLAAHADVRDALVVARENDGAGKQLVAYYTGGKIGAEALRDHVSSALPDYMVPSAYVHLEDFPLLPSGKLDRQALPRPEDVSCIAHGYQPPQGDTEIQLAEIWADLLRIERVGRHDNFFELGGHSLLATMLVVRVQQEIAVEIGVADVFKLPELALLAEHIVNAQLAGFDAEELAEMAASLNVP